MSIRDRLIDAQALRSHGRFDGALLMDLVALAATSRKRYPRPCTDREAFVRFFNDERATIDGGPHEKPPPTHKQRVPAGFQPGETHRPPPSPFPDDMADILYRYLRNNLVHEAKVGDKVEWDERGLGFNIYDGNAFIGVSPALLIGLEQAILRAPENIAEPATATN